ncbi:MAG: HPr family phosphocarrier protein [Acholeplasmataceae bacterium]|nr:HPr family phosphocarrier protein [Acholeplasmataceae bacterium]
MYKKTVQVKNQSGLHARPGSDFVALATKFNSNIKINKVDQPNRVANAKSIIFVLSLGIKKDTILDISAEGSDEVAAVDQLVALIEGGFGEL